MNSAAKQRFSKVVRSATSDGPQFVTKRGDEVAVLLGLRRLARRDPGRAGGFEKWLIDLQELYGNRVVPVTAAIAEVRGRLTAGDPLPAADGLMAATALVHGWTFVTRSTADVVQTGVRLINPFGVDQ